MKNKLLFLSASDIRKALTMKSAINAMKDAFISLYRKEAVVPPRIHTDVEKFDSTALFMPVYLSGKELFGLKMVTLANKNPEKGLPLIHALIIVMDVETGKPVGILDGASITAIRTGAGSGLATDLLSRPDSEVAAIFGAGVQGRTQLEAVCSVRTIKKAYIFDINKSAAKKFATEMSADLSIEVEAAGSDSCLKEADIICTATTSLSPVFSHENLKTGVHINGVGAYKPYMQEIPEKTVINSKIIIDNEEGCLMEAGDIIIPINNGLITNKSFYAEIGEIAAGDIQGRETDREITFYKSVGNAVQDLAAAAEAIKSANELKIGTILEL